VPHALGLTTRSHPFDRSRTIATHQVTPVPLAFSVNNTGPYCFDAALRLLISVGSPAGGVVGLEVRLVCQRDVCICVYMCVTVCACQCDCEGQCLCSGVCVCVCAIDRNHQVDTGRVLVLFAPGLWGCDFFFFFFPLSPPSLLPPHTYTCTHISLRPPSLSQHSFALGFHYSCKLSISLVIMMFIVVAFIPHPLLTRQITRRQCLGVRRRGNRRASRRMYSSSWSWLVANTCISCCKIDKD
jgi:hypothetical protein